MNFLRSLKPRSLGEWFVIILVIVMLMATIFLVVSRQLIPAAAEQEAVRMQAKEMKSQVTAMTTVTKSTEPTSVQTTVKATEDPQKQEAVKAVEALDSVGKMSHLLSSKKLSVVLSDIKKYSEEHPQEEEVDAPMVMPEGLIDAGLDMAPQQQAPAETAAPETPAPETPAPQDLTQYDKPLQYLDTYSQLSAMGDSAILRAVREAQQSPAPQLPYDNGHFPNQAAPGVGQGQPDGNQGNAGAGNAGGFPNDNGGSAGAGGDNVPPTPPADISPATIEAVKNNIFSMINAGRANAGLSAISWDPTMQAISNQRAVDLSQYYGHNRPDGTSWYNWINAMYGGGETYAAGENIANFGSISRLDAAYIYNSFFNSGKGHREIMNNARNVRGAVGVYVAGNHIYVVMNFGF